MNNSITLLHVSDTQFGRNHRFGNLLAVGDPDAGFDTLFRRLSTSLSDLKEKEGIEPEVIVVSGDLAEEGKISEFDDARDFLTQLSEALNVPRSRVVLVPGNHDVNRAQCEGYFKEREGDEGTPIPPYWRKWKSYSRMFNEFFTDEPLLNFTEEEYWSFWEIEDLKLVVAGLNSTIAESHRNEDHYGLVGEKQALAMAARLSDYRKRGWFRLGVIHHNVNRAPIDDDENLRDVDLLEMLLAPTLNLLLHGHTHNSKISWLGDPPIPVLSTGSAGLRSEARPPGLPNQYQVLKISPDRIVRWTLGYAPDQKRWIGDTRCSRDGREWQVEHSVNFDSIHAAFGEGDPAAPPAGVSPPKPPGPPGPQGADSQLAARDDELHARKVTSTEERALAEVSRLMRERRSVVVSGPEGIGKTRLLETLRQEHRDSRTLDLVPVRFEDGREPREVLQLALHLRFGGSFVPGGGRELSVLRPIVPEGTVLLVDSTDSSEATDAVKSLLEDLPNVTAVVCGKAGNFPDFAAVDLASRGEEEVKAILAEFDLDDRTATEVMTAGEGNPQRLRQLAAAAVDNGRSDPENQLASMLEHWPAGALRSLWLIRLLPSSILSKELLMEVGGMSEEDLALMQRYAVAEVIPRGEPASAFVSIHPQLVRFCRESREPEEDVDREDLIADAARHYVDWLSSGPPTEAVDAALENLMHLLKVVTDPSLRADLAVALIGDDLDDPSGYIPSRGLTQLLLDEQLQRSLEETARHVGASRAGPILKNLGLFMHRANKPGAEYVLRKAKEAYERIGNVNGIASTNWILGAVAEDTGSYREAVNLFREPLLDASDPTIRALSHHLEGCAHYHWGDFALARKSFEDASKEAWGQSAAIRLRIDRGLAYVNLADGEAKDEAQEKLIELRERAEELGRPREAARCTRHIGKAQMQLGDLEGARQSLEQARDRFQRLGDQRGLGATLCDLATALRKEEDLDAAREAALGSLRIARGEESVMVPMNSPLGVARIEEELAEIEQVANPDARQMIEGHLRHSGNIFEAIHHPCRVILAERLGDRRDAPFPPAKGIVFDLVDTLAVVDSDAYENAKREISRALEVDHDLFKQAWARSRWEASTDSRVTPQKRIESVASELDRELDADEARALAKKERELWTQSVAIEESTLEALKTLKKKGIKMALVTNGSSAMRKLPEDLGLMDYLEGSLLSCEVGVLKPKPEIYEQALARLELAPGECIFVGDGSDRELEGAKANDVGLFAVRMTGYRKQRPEYTSRDSLDWDASVGSLQDLLKRMDLGESGRSE